MVANEYHHDLQTERIRNDLKELEVLQKNGPSFKVDGYHVEWQKWSFMVGFNVSRPFALHADQSLRSVSRGNGHLRCEIRRTRSVPQIVIIRNVSLASRLPNDQS